MTTSKPNVLILGGCGFIGRHLIEYLIDNELAAVIRVVDKTPPQMAWLNEKHKLCFNNPIVEFCSANLINEASCKNAFLPPTNDSKWNYVFNCAAETRPNQSDAVYNEGITKLSRNCISESRSLNVDRYIEFSSGCMVSSENSRIKEDCDYEPWTFLARHKANVEKELKSKSDVPYTILRLPLVYGKSDRRGLAPRIVIAALYKCLNETMKLLWNDSMKLNTIHVLDVVTAAWTLAISPKACNQIYNIVDDSESTQGSLSNVLGDIFNIKIDYWGVIMSSITKVKMNDVIDEINDKHMEPWAEVCQKDNVDNTPLTPYMDEELLFYKHLNLDNKKLKDFGYELKYPLVKREIIEEIIDDYIKEKLFPPSLGY